jgi:hypothetical protein
MQYTFSMENRLCGFVSASVRGPGEASIVTREFTSSEDGGHLLGRLEEVSRLLLMRLPTERRVRESQIDHLIAIFHRDGRVEVRINEPGFVASMRTKRPVILGELVLLENVADVDRFEPRGLSIPDDCGYLVIFSVGWQKALVFDFEVLDPTVQVEARDVPSLLGAAYSYLTFRDRLALTDADWANLLAQRWFPFAGLSFALVEKMLAHLRSGWNVDELLPEIGACVRSGLPELRTAIQTDPLFDRHRDVLLPSFDAYDRGEYGLAVSGIYPRIEGLLRERVARTAAPSNKYPALAKSVAAATPHPQSALLPARFTHYLERVFFDHEDFSNPLNVVKVTRHAVAHGVIDPAALDEKAATLGVLVIHQLANLLTDKDKTISVFAAS